MSTLKTIKQNLKNKKIYKIKITQREIASLFQVVEETISRTKKAEPFKFEAMRNATICDKYNITEDKLFYLLELTKDD